MNIFKAFAIAFSMYSKIPMPVFEWKKENLKYSICFFPLVGAVIAIGINLLNYLLVNIAVDIPLAAKAIFFLVVPVIISGGIHIDGYMDTSDALSSFGEKEKKLEILKDPHIGAFAVIRLIVYSSLFFAFVLTFLSASPSKNVFLSWTLCFILSRILSAISVVSFKCAKNEGTLYTFAEGSEKKICKIILYIELLICSAAVIYFGGISGIIELLVAGLVFLYYHHMAKDKFCGITGDIAGYFVCLCEACVTFGFMLIR